MGGQPTVLQEVYRAGEGAIPGSFSLWLSQGAMADGAQKTSHGDSLGEASLTPLLPPV